VDSKKQNKQTTKEKQTHKYKEQTGGCQRGDIWGMQEINGGN